MSFDRSAGPLNRPAEPAGIGCGCEAVVPATGGLDEAQATRASRGVLDIVVACALFMAAFVLAVCSFSLSTP